MSSGHSERIFSSCRRALCRLLGHRWHQMSLACGRCRRTQLEIERGPYDPEVERRVTDAYWRGVADGRKIDRRRTYLLGYSRGGRDMWNRVQDVLRV